MSEARFRPATRKSAEFLIFLEARAPMAIRRTKYRAITIVPKKSNPITTQGPEQEQKRDGNGHNNDPDKCICR